MCKVRLRKVGEVKEYCPLSENIFCVQGGLLDVEHFVFNVKALRLLGAREYRGESSIEFRMTRAGFFAWLCILVCVGALDSLIIVFSLIFMSIYSGTLEKLCPIVSR